MKTLLLVLAFLLAAQPLAAQTRTVPQTLPITGTLAATDASIVLPIPPGQAFATVAIEVTGTWGGVISLQCAIRDNFQSVRMQPYQGGGTPPPPNINSISANGNWWANVAGCQKVRAYATFISSGTATVTMNGIALTSPGFGSLQDVNCATGCIPTNDPCITTARQTFQIDQAADAIIVPNNPGVRTYICAISFGGGIAAEVLSLVEGTGTACGTSESALVGGVTDANGINLAIGTLATFGTGSNAVIQAKNLATDICLHQVGTTHIAGFVTFVQR